MSDTLYIDDALFAKMERASRKVQRRLELATAALNKARVPYVIIGGLAVAAWVRTVDKGADRGTPNVDLMVSPADVAKATSGLSISFDFREGFRFAEEEKLLTRSAVRIWPLNGTLFHKDDFDQASRLEGRRYVSLDALVRAKLALGRRIDRVHVRDLIGVGLVDAAWLDSLSAALATGLKELLDDPEG